MSKKQILWYNHWERVEDYLNLFHFSRDGQPLSQRDEATWVSCVIQHAILTEDLVSLGCDDPRMSRWIEFVANTHDVLDILKVYKDADAWLLSQIEHHFLASNGSKLRLPFEWEPFLSPVWTYVVNFFNSRGEDLRALRILHQWLAYPSRVNLRDYEDYTQIQEWLAIDAELTNVDISDGDMLNAIIREWLTGFRVTGKPSHGNGAVAEDLSKVFGKSLLGKYYYLGIDETLAEVAKNADLDLEKFAPGGSFDFLPFGRTPGHTSVLQEVPKTALKRRIICKEPAAMQFWQHMVQYDIYRWIDAHPVLSQHIRLTDASLNERAARHGSVTGRLATVDLSAASDRVSYRVVRTLFAGTELLQWLDATRTSSTLVPEEGTQSRRVSNRFIRDESEKPEGWLRVRTNKYAPMGSALCFPVETLVFSACCELTCRRFMGVDHHSSWRAYGDDLIIERELVLPLIECLERLGFKVNHDKTFHGMGVVRFRESCGGEFVNGYDVTPLRISRKFEGGPLYLTQDDEEGSRLARRWEAQIEAANDAIRYGYTGLYKWLTRSFRSLPRDFWPAMGDGPGQLKRSFGATYPLWGEARLRKPSSFGSTESYYQVPYVKCGQTSVKYSSFHGMGDKADFYEECRYLEWWLRAIRRDQANYVVGEDGYLVLSDKTYTRNVGNYVAFDDLVTGSKFARGTQCLEILDAESATTDCGPSFVKGSYDLYKLSGTMCPVEKIALKSAWVPVVRPGQ